VISNLDVHAHVSLHLVLLVGEKKNLLCMDILQDITDMITAFDFPLLDLILHLTTNLLI